MANATPQDSDDLDFEALLRAVIDKHTLLILTAFQRQLQRGPLRNIFSAPGVVTLVKDGNITFLTRSCLHSDEYHRRHARATHTSGR